MEFKYFRLIKTIAEQGNIANSSQQLFLTQSALSHQLRQLEDRLGFKVFYRTRNHWQLTKEGEALYQLANQLIDTLEEGFSNIRKIKNGAKGTLKVSAECQSYFHGLPAFVQKMAILYPEISVDLHMDITSQAISQLLGNEIDIAIVTAAPASEQLMATKVFEDEIKMLVHPEHHLSNKPFLDASDFAKVHLLINSFPLEGVSVYEHFLKPNRIVPVKVSAIPFTEVAIQLVGANMGVMCVPEWAITSFTVTKDYLLKRIGKNGLKRDHFMVMRKADQHLEYFNNFSHSLLEEFSNF